MKKINEVNWFALKKYTHFYNIDGAKFTLNSIDLLKKAFLAIILH